MPVLITVHSHSVALLHAPEAVKHNIYKYFFVSLCPLTSLNCLLVVAR